VYRHNGYTNIGHDYHDVINVCILYKLSYTISGDPYMDESLTNTVSGLMQYRGFYLNDGIWLLYSRQHLGNNHSSLMHWALKSCIETFNHFSCDHLFFQLNPTRGDTPNSHAAKDAWGEIECPWMPPAHIAWSAHPAEPRQQKWDVEEDSRETQLYSY
jgi:hypothetical protein